MGGNKGDERGVLQLGVENEEAEGTEVVRGNSIVYPTVIMAM